MDDFKPRGDSERRPAPFKQPFTTPRLFQYGRLASLTLNGDQSGTDGGSVANMMMGAKP